MKNINQILFLLLSFLFITCSSSDDENNQTPQQQNSAPWAFDLTTVANEATAIVLLPSFSWEESVDADGDAVNYDFYLDTNSNPTTKLASDLTSESYTIASSLLYENVYYWKVVAKDTEGATTTSTIYSFTTVAEAINAAQEGFDLLMPTNQATEADLLPTLTWQTAEDPEGDVVTYNLYLDTNTDPETLLEEDLSETSYTLTNALENNTTYYWKVVATDEQGNATESVTFSFTTSPPVLSLAINLTAVANEETDVVLLPTLTWESNSTNAVTYDLYLSLDTSPEIYENDLTDNLITLTENLKLNQTYYWKVVVKDDQGNQAESSVFSFTTKGLNLSATALTNAAAFSPRAYHTSVVFNNKIWVIGGYDGNGVINGGVDFYNEVWSSSDGVSWTLETNAPGFIPRYDHASIVFDNKIWVIGGKGFDVPGRAANAPFEELNDVWNSLDGVNWTQVTDDAPFDACGGHTLNELNGKIYLISGGYNSFGTEDVWSTSNGLTWTLETDDLAFDTNSRHNHRVVALDNSFYLTGGATVAYDEVWKSDDLLNWTMTTDNQDFLARRANSFLNFNDNLIYFGGLLANRSDTNTAGYFQDIWYSVDGENWLQGAEQAPYFERYQHTSVVFNGKIFIIAGKNAGGYLNDVWSID